ncbi:MAG: AbrB/MazE/SpoVT family DNA-binding domain-containing protein [Bacilli bacterium]|nr:AbrB/MazE/SpoVT family DNA-binding domain-containing protein [Bacilli bacterium]
MKSTGITRRIDDLGRIVIPKEIRKNLKIKENEILEVFVENENIILKKFSSFDDMDKTFTRFIEVLENITFNSVLITNRDKILNTSINKKYDYLNKEIGRDIINCISNKEDLLNKGLVELIVNKQIDTNCYIKPIINNGDTLGSIVIFGNKNIEEKDILAVEIISKLIINYID